jgi:tetratricopeptide (TPR) repeat protein
VIRLVFASVLILSPLVFADELREQSRLHYELGRAAYSRHEWARALSEFKKAYEIVPIPDFIYNIGRCQEQLGQFKNAAASYRLFIATKPDAAERTQLEEHISALDSEFKIPPSPPPLAVTAPRPPLAVTAPPPAPPKKKEKPIYRRWWLWTSIAAVVVAGVAVGVGVGVGTSQSGPPSLGFPAVTVR